MVKVAVCPTDTVSGDSSLIITGFSFFFSKELEKCLDSGKSSSVLSLSGNFGLVRFHSWVSASAVTTELERTESYHKCLQ